MFYQKLERVLLRKILFVIRSKDKKWIQEENLNGDLLKHPYSHTQASFHGHLQTFPNRKQKLNLPKSAKNKKCG